MNPPKPPPPRFVKEDDFPFAAILIVALLLFLAALCARADGTFSGANTFTTPGTFTIQSGVTLSGTWNFTNATVQGLTVGAAGVNGELQWNNTGVLNGLSTLTTDGQDITTPASRFFFVDITDPSKKARLTLANVPTGQSVQVNVSDNSTTVVGDAGAANNFLTGISTVGAVTKARPTIANLTDLSGASKLIGAGSGGAGVVELSLGANLSISGTTINASTGGVGDGDKGDISVTGGGGTWTIDAQAVSYSKLQNVTQNRILGRISSGSGQVEELTGAQVTPLLSTFSDSTAGLVPASGGGTTTYLRADHTFAAPPGSGTVTTTGSPFINSLALFSGTTSITNLHNALGVAGFIKIGTDDLVTMRDGAGFRSDIGAGTVTSFSAGDLSPLFTTTESTVTTTPALTFNLSNAPSHEFFGNNTSGSAPPAWHRVDYIDLQGTVPISAIYLPGVSLLGRDTAGNGPATPLAVVSPLSISSGYLQISDGTISRAKLIDSPGLSVIGRAANSAGDPVDISTTAGSNAILRETGGGAIGWGQIATGGIANSAVTLAKIQNAALAGRLLGSNSSGGNAPYTELTARKNLNIDATGLDSGHYATGENQTGFSTDTYINGSRVSINAGSLTVGMMYHAAFNMSKTAAGTAALRYTLRIGTNGSGSDFAAVDFVPNINGTAAADIGLFEVWCYVRSSGGSTVVAGTTRITKNGTTTGLMNTGGQLVVTNPVTGSSFNSSSATKVGLSFNGGTSFSGTLGFIQAELIEP